jgi:hypothetical protein
VKASLDQQVGTYARFSVGLGAVRRFLFGFDTVGSLPAMVAQTPKAENRLFGDLSLDLDFSPNEPRRDKHDTASLGVRFLPSVQQGIPAATYTNFSAQYVVAVGWHEAWLRVNGTALTGFVPFTDEESLGAHVHGPFGSVFTRKLATVGGEFRYSLWRDVFKVGPYVEAVVFGNIDRTTDRQSPLVGAVAGAMMSGLFFDQFVFETYFGLGSMTDGRSELGLSLAIRQAY